MTLSEQKERFEQVLRARDIEPTFTCDGEYSGAFVQSLWEMFRLGFDTAVRAQQGGQP